MREANGEPLMPLLVSTLRQSDR